MRWLADTWQEFWQAEVLRQARDGVKTTDSDKQVDMPAGPKHDIHVAAANQTAERDTRLANAASSNPQSNIINCCCVMNASVATTSIAYIHHCLARGPKGDDWLCPGCEVQEAYGAKKRTLAGSECPLATWQA
jgi:hypothetical protein